MHVVTYGLPTLRTIAIAERVAELSGPKSEYQQVYHSSLDVEAVLAGGVTIALDDGTRYIAPALGSSRKRSAKKRGWGRIHLIEAARQSAKLEVRGYLFFGTSCRTPERSVSEPSLVLFRAPSTASFLACVPDERSIADLSLPGTHDTCAFYGCELWGVLPDAVLKPESPCIAMPAAHHASETTA